MSGMSRLNGLLSIGCEIPPCPTGYTAVQDSAEAPVGKERARDTTHKTINASIFLSAAENCRRVFIWRLRMRRIKAEILTSGARSLPEVMYTHLLALSLKCFDISRKLDFGTGLQSMRTAEPRQHSWDSAASLFVVCASQATHAVAK